MNEYKHLVALGGGGHFISVAAMLTSTDWRVGAVVDSSSDCLARDYVASDLLFSDQDLPRLRENFSHGIVTCGQIKSSSLRRRLWHSLQELDFICPPIKAGSAIVMNDSLVGAGSLVMHRVVVNAKSFIGKNCILNTGAIVEHECQVGDHVHIATGATLNGGVTVGTGSFVGSGSIIRERVTIGENCLIGAGVFVRHDLADGTLVVG